MSIHPIESESYRILEQRVDLSAFPPLSRAVVARVVHASADVELAASMVLDEGVLEEAVRKLRAGAPVVTDVRMVAAGLVLPAHCFLDRVGADAQPTRSAAAIRVAAAEHRRGAVFVIGCAPTALTELVALSADGGVEPALVIGLPVGFVGAAESKTLLRDSGLPAVTNVGEKGGSAVAAAALNALARAAGMTGTGGDDA
ncbi:MAG TPA: precorrin-8X methylmutase [Acidimicrobiales bacterium]|nr:precorrin-8X methylmutase [Acidimicrobiales bacterium]